jgi:hypothetical protein
MNHSEGESGVSQVSPDSAGICRSPAGQSGLEGKDKSDANRHEGEKHRGRERESGEDRIPDGILAPALVKEVGRQKREKNEDTVH